MTGKVQKIREWVKARLDENTSKQSLPQFYGMMEEDARFLDFLDSLQEEPVSEDLEEASWIYYNKNRLPIPPEWDLHKEFIDFFKAGARWQKSKDESFTEELEEVSKKYSSCIYLEEVLSDDDKEVLKERLINTFKAGAKWQKEQMMAKGVDGVVHHFEKCGVASVHYKDPTGVPMSYFISPKGLVAGDKVKVIAIKED